MIKCLLAASALLALALTACLGRPGLPAQQPPRTGADAYVLGQSDEVEVQVWQEPDMCRTACIRSDGMLSLPLLGDVKAEGLTAAGLRELLTRRYGELLAEPVVSVIVTRPLSATFFVTGQVLKPGEYSLSKQTELLQAIATAGGFTKWARRGRIVVIRSGGERLRVDYDDIVGGDTGGNITLRRGDVVVVP
jgi:polysaccharide export outer membrane protein